MLDWFKVNSMKTNPGKFQFLFLGVKNVNGKIILCSNEVKLLGITIDNELNRLFELKNQTCSSNN